MAVEPLYRPIEPNVGFRVLVLHPAAKFADDIICNLIPATLRNCPSYEALSYVWGTDSERRTVTLEGQVVQVTVNLERALRHLRLTDQPRKLWVDALCIDQANIEERNRHVQYMTGIYANCTVDVLWFGEDDTVISNGREVLNRFGTLMNLDAQIHELEDEMEDSLHALFSEPAVWKRVWIMQEVAYAPKVQLIAGTTTMWWEILESFFDTDAYVKKFGVVDAYHGPYSHEWSVRSLFNRAMAYPHILAQQRRITQHTGHDQVKQSSAIDVLSRYRYTDATDPRDKVIALLGLTSGQLQIPVDYAAPVHEFYIQTATKLMEIDGNLDLICQGPWQLHGRGETIEGLPSWVPDFSNPGDSQILYAHRGIFDACGSKAKPDIAVLQNGTLRVNGYFLDRLAMVRTTLKAWSKTHDTNTISQGQYHRNWETILFWMPTVQLEESIRQGNLDLKTFPRDSASEPVATPASGLAPTYESYWRTLMMDCMRYPNRRIDPGKDLDSLRTKFSDFLSLPLESDDRRSLEYTIESLVSRNCTKWRFAMTEKCFYCMVPPDSGAQDVIAILDGAKTPIVLRPMSEGRYQWIGACYVHDLMDGQILAMSLTKTTFDIV